MFNRKEMQMLVGQIRDGLTARYSPETAERIFCAGLAAIWLEACGVTDVRVLQSLFPNAEPPEWPEKARMQAFLCASDDAAGRLFQMYRSAEKDAVSQKVLGGAKVQPKELPAATQLFTPNWLTDYLLENSLGRYLSEQGTLSASEKASFRYYESAASLGAPAPKALGEITVLDPCVGSGVFLQKAFQMLVQAHLLQGADAQEAAVSVLQNQLFGLDVDESVCRIARLSVWMTARRFCPNLEKFLLPGALVHICAIRPATEAEAEKSPDTAKFYAQASQFGALLMPPPALAQAPVLQMQTALLSRKYDIVCTNPPYLGKKYLTAEYAAFLHENYPSGSSDLYAAFIARCRNWVCAQGYCAMLTMQSWMYLHSFAKLRAELLSEETAVTVLHTGAGTFEEVSTFNALAVAFVLRHKALQNEKTVFCDMTDARNPAEQESRFAEPSRRKCINCRDFADIPEAPLVYQQPEALRAAFRSFRPLSDFAAPKQGLATADNARFVRFWHEVEPSEIAFPGRDATGKKWFPYNKGGNFRRWYGMNEYVVDWENDGEAICRFRDAKGKLRSRPQNRACYFLPGITWSLFGFRNFGVRWKNAGFLFDVSGSSLFPPEEWARYTLGYLASSTAFAFLSALAPTVNFQVGNIADLPFCTDEARKPEIDRLVQENIRLAQADWDAFETSWDFAEHPYLRLRRTEKADAVLLSELDARWQAECAARNRRLAENEAAINRHFAEIFGVRSCVEITPDAAEIEATCRLGDAARDSRLLISYILGCLLGRYGSDGSGLTPNGGNGRFISYEAALSGISAFIRTQFGEATFPQNLQWLSERLGGRGTPQERIFAYLSKHFYAEHEKRMQKHPYYRKTEQSGRSGLEIRLESRRNPE